MIDLITPSDPEPIFSWKYEMKEAEKLLAKRIAILEKTGNVECTIRTKRHHAKLVKKVKELWTVA